MPPRLPRRSPAPRTLVPGLLALLMVVAVGCTSTTELGEPSPTPADMGGVAVRLQQAGVTIAHIVSGDAGCSDPELKKAAIGFSASGIDQPTPVAAHIYIFRNDASYQKLRPSVDACAKSYISDPSTYEVVDASPYVVAGQGPWPSGFKAAIRQGLEMAASQGG